MKSQAELAFLLAESRRQQERDEARQYRLAAKSRPAQPRKLRAYLGRPLLWLGTRLAGDESGLEAARAR